MAKRPTLTTTARAPVAEPTTNDAGIPVSSDEFSLTVGPDGPILLQDHYLIEQMANFNRERVPERQPHAKGSGAFGHFEVTQDVSKYTKAALFQPGTKTDMLARFSTVAGERGSPDTWRDPRGFAVKFYTKDGNWDLVGNNLPLFFIRDALKFPDMVHAFKPDPVTNSEEPWRFYDFVMNTPESLHMVTWVKSPWGIPATYREMIGSGVNTYRWINDRGEAFLIKYHWFPKAGVRNLTAQQAAELQAKDVGHATRDLYEAIERGDYPEWELSVQVMPEGEHPELTFDPLDDTKLWPEDQFPKRPVGRMVLNRNPKNFFAEVEQAAFGTGVLVDGMDFSDDKMLIGRTFSYSDTQRYRVGPNYLQLPINKPQVPTHTNQRDGQMAYYVDDSGKNPHVNYEPSSESGLSEAPKPERDWYQHVEAHVMRHGILRTADDYTQAGERYSSFEAW